MTSLSHKELMLLQDNIRMCQETAQFLQTCVNIAGDQQLKNICQQLLTDHNQDVQKLSRHITQANIQ
ncbi:MAG TPA: hypothetical protein PK830_00840 [Candidatus Atribacteria bacterium]|nr:hypothetical protein [Candidatus Atribacteria bacterium]HPT77645.1 hypothetical protein [Candidatus Atribacteria bacterium]